MPNVGLVLKSILNSSNDTVQDLDALVIICFVPHYLGLYLELPLKHILEPDQIFSACGADKIVSMNKNQYVSARMMEDARR